MDKFKFIPLFIETEPLHIYMIEKIDLYNYLKKIAGELYTSLINQVRLYIILNKAYILYLINNDSYVYNKYSGTSSCLGSYPHSFHFNNFSGKQELMLLQEKYIFFKTFFLYKVKGYKSPR